MKPLIWRMLLARGSVKKAFKTARVCQIRHAPLKAFLYSPRIQNHCAKSGKLGFFNELRKRVRTSHVGGSFSVWGIEEGIEALAKPIFVRAQPFNGSGTAVPFNGWHAPCLAGMSHARTLRLIVRGGKELIIA